MNYGIKVSKKDYDVVTGKPGTKKTKKKRTSHIYSVFALPYLKGAQIQISRYQEATKMLTKNSGAGVILCIHEASCLFEDLATVKKYLEKMGHSHRLHTNIRDIRNHIRHDIREEYDHNKSDKVDRLKRLGIATDLQTQIGFDQNEIKLGTTQISLKDIKDYLAWAENIFGSELKDAQDKGYVRKEK